jgi:hypothetical protein
LSNSEKKILIVTYAFYPELSPRSFRATELANEFARQGHFVKVITRYQPFDYSEFLKHNNISLRLLDPPKFPQIKIAKSGFLNLVTRGISRILGLLFEYPLIETMFMVKRALKNEEGYDLLVSIAVPFANHWGVALSRNKKHRIANTWIADCGDPYMFAKLDTFRKPFYFKYTELKFCRECDYISVPFEEMASQFYPQFRSKITVIPQGFNFKEIKLSEEPVNNSKPTFVFAGSIIPGKRDLNLFVDILSTLDIDFRFRVFTSQEQLFIPYRQKLKDKIEISGYISRNSLLFELSKADFVVNVDTILDNSKNVEAFPSKLIDYALSGRPILNINSGESDRELVLSFLKKDYSRQRIVDRSKYDIEIVSRQFLGLVN